MGLEGSWQKKDNCQDSMLSNALGEELGGIT